MALRFALAACSALCLLRSGEAGSITFDAAPGPSQFVLQGRYRFYVAQGSIQKGLSTVTLTDLKFKSEKPTNGTLQVGVMPVREFSYLQESKDGFRGLCTGAQPFAWNKELRVVGAELIQEAKSLELKLPQGGAYMLVLANCAVNSTITITGTVALRNSWGFLDTIDFWKVPIYGGSLLLMAFASLVFIFFVMQQDEELRDVQYYAILISVLGIAESSMQVFALFLENQDGKSRDWLREPAYLVKLLYLCAFLTQMGQGLGFTQQRLDICATAKSYTIVLVFLIALMPKICFFSIRPHMASVDLGEEVRFVAGLVVVSFFTVCWLTMTLGRTFGELKKQDDTEALQAFRRMVTLLFAILFAAMIALGVQVGTSADAEAEWLYAFTNDGIAAATIALATCVLMYLSMQNYTSKSLQMSSLPTHEGDVGGATGVDCMDDDDDEEANLFGQGKSKPEQGGDEDEGDAALGGKGPSAETIGAAGAME